MNLENRRTRIIATIGPATDSPAMLEKLIKAGMNIARLNMSHATPESARAITEHIREISKRLDKQVGILMDTQGPAIRTGDLPVALDLNPGDTIALTVRGEMSEEMRSVDVNYDDLVNDINVGDVVLVDNGQIHLKVLSKHQNHLECEVLTEGTLGSRRHINLPGVRVNLPALTEKDLRDVELGIEIGVDFFAMSFVREAQDVLRLKAILDYRRASQRVIAKLEDQQGVSNLESIIAVADGIMVARGDLGIECPYEELPIIQRRIVKHCITVGKPVIVATHMLESMIENPSPTRAEITDVANAVFEQADAIMLSGETSVGQYPVKCIEIMDRVARRIERSGGAGYAELAKFDTKRAQIMKSAAVLAKEVKARAIVIFTKKGNMPRYAAWMRSLHTEVYTFTANDLLLNQLSIHWGCTAFHIDLVEDATELNVATAMKVLRDRGLATRGDNLVFVTDVKLMGKMIDTILMEKLD